MDDNIIKKVKPHNNQAEKYILGSMLLDRNVITDIADLLVGDDFYNKQYGLIYDTMVELYNEGKAVDIVTVPDRLVKKDVPQDISNPELLISIISDTPTSANATDHAKLIQEKAMLRKLISFCEGLEDKCYSEADTVENIIEDATKDLFAVAKNRGANDVTPLKDIILQVIHEMEVASVNQGKVTGLSTGFTDLDNMLTGLHGGELILVAARPAMGKTAFALNIIHNVAVHQKVPCAVFSLEMSKEQLVGRVMALDAMVDSKKMKLGDLSDEGWDKVLESSDFLVREAAPIFIRENTDMTIGYLRSECRNLKQKYNIGLIVLDYLQLMSASGRVESRQQFISEVSRALKNIARELNVPVIALSQLSRAVDSRPDHKPVLSDLRESGAIEQDADVVMFIYRDEYYNPDTTTKPQTAEIIIAKQRAGETGSVDLRWIGKYTKFANPEKHQN